MLMTGQSVKLIFILTFIISISYQGIGKTIDYRKQIKPGRWLKNIKLIIDEKSGEYNILQIYFPAGYQDSKKQRTLIALHPYAGSEKDFEENTRIESLANQYNCVIVCPAMGKTVYETEYFNETMTKWASQPGGVYIKKTLLTFMHKELGLARDADYTGIFGIDRGGRGALLMACLYPDDFGAVAGISGDYDPLSMPNDKLLTAMYGPYNEFKERWEKKDNIMNFAENLKNIPVFLAHGSKDYITPSGQSFVLAMQLKLLQKKSSGYSVVYHEKKFYSRDWKYWNMVLPDMMAFFDEKLDK